MAETGATQGVVQDRLQAQHGVSMETGRLRELAAHLSGEMSAVRQEFPVAKLLDLLDQAKRSCGGRKPVLSMGRDGITLCEYPHGAYAVATSATVTVFDRSGKRLETVYLAYVPE